MNPLLLLVAMSSTVSPEAAPSPAASLPAYELRLEVDAPVLVVAGMISFGWVLRDELAPPFCGPDACRKDSVFILDRFAAGRFDAGFRTVSDATVAATYGLAALTLVLDEGLENGVNDAVVVAQAILWSNALGVLANLGARRPRPLAYGTEASLEERTRGNTSLSFFSGHTAGTFAAAVAMYSTLKRLHPSSPMPYVALGIGLGVASFVGVSRVLAGDHFPTDVLVGAAVGTSLGLLVPALHDAPVRFSASAGVEHGLLQVGGAF